MTQTRGPDDWNQPIIEEFRANDGKVGGYFAGAPMILIHAVGARSGSTGQPARLPAGRRGHDRRGDQGRVSHEPDWYHNLKAHPRVQVEVGTETVPVEATEVTGPERDELWRRFVELRPSFAEYETKTTRLIPMFRLTRVP